MNPARPMPGTRLCALEDVPDPGGRALDFAEGAARFSLIVTRRGGTAAAFENVCPHARWPLEAPDGRVIVQDGRFLVCAAHGASFGLIDGACHASPGPLKPLTPVAIVVRDGWVWSA